MSHDWRPVPEYPQYEVSRDGSVRSVTRMVPCRGGGQRVAVGGPMRPSADRKGYLRVPVGDGRLASVHAMVAGAFLGPRPAGAQVDHVDGDKANNAVENLRYVTGSENVRAAHAVGRNKSGITDADVRFIRRMHADGQMTQDALASYFGVHQSFISRLVTREYRAHVV